jgi:hypothetical protein
MPYGLANGCPDESNLITKTRIAIPNLDAHREESVNSSWLLPDAIGTSGLCLTLSFRIQLNLCFRICAYQTASVYSLVHLSPG